MSTSPANFAERLNLFLYRNHIRRLGPSEVESAKEWCVDLIRREHPKLTDAQVEEFYENLINMKISAVDEWTRRMS